MTESNEPGEARRRRIPTWLAVLVAIVAVVAIGAWLLANHPPQSVLQTISCPVHGPSDTPKPNLPEVCRW